MLLVIDANGKITGKSFDVGEDRNTKIEVVYHTCEAYYIRIPGQIIAGGTATPTVNYNQFFQTQVGKDNGVLIVRIVNVNGVPQKAGFTVDLKLQTYEPKPWVSAAEVFKVQV